MNNWCRRVICVVNKNHALLSEPMLLRTMSCFNHKICFIRLIRPKIKFQVEDSGVFLEALCTTRMVLKHCSSVVVSYQDLAYFFLDCFDLITRNCSSSESAQLNESQDKLLPETDQENDEISERRPILRTDCDYGTTPLNTSIQNSWYLDAAQSV